MIHTLEAMDTILAGHYHIIRHLGGGGFGQTFLARDSHLPGRPLCVVKQLKPRVTEPATLEIAKRLFDREAETLYRLGNHDQIPRLLAHFEQDNEFYLVQEYIAGQPLDRELVHGQMLPEAAITELLQDLLTVLAFVHQQKVIHRDIKPSNLIRRSHDNKIVLIDFGAVKEVSSSTIYTNGQTSMTIAIGSPGYMPSEQQSFHPRFSSDIYAVGIVGLQAFTGLYPSELPRDPDTGEIHCGLLRDRITVSPGLVAILDRMVRYDYRQRYPNATEALNALHNLLHPGSAPTVLPSIPSYPYAGETEAIEVTPDQATKTVSLPPMMAVTNLPVDIKNRLEDSLIKEIGPVASVVLKQGLGQCPTYEELIDYLTKRLPDQTQTRFREEATRLLKPLGGQATLSQQQSTVQSSGNTVPVTPSTSASAASSATSLIDPDFVKRCELELTKAIGPIAPLMVRRTLAQHPNVSRSQLIDILATHLPNPAAANAFRQTLT